MAQLRDAKTSDILAEGEPIDVVLIADEIGRDEVLFDDVGEGFDPDAVVEAHPAGKVTKKKVDAAKKAMKEARGR